MARNTANPAPPITDPVARAAAAGTGGPPECGWASLVAELSVSDIGQSLTFWCDMLGFELAYDRPAARFAYLCRGPLQVMLCERNGRWEPAEMQRPFGRGINLQMAVDRIAPILAALASANWPLFEQPNDAWYRAGKAMRGQREFLVQDPDGYLLRFFEVLETDPPTFPP